MSGTDAYRPSKRIEVVQVHQEFVNVPVRKYVGMEHDEKRASASARVLRNQDIAEQEWREQVQDVRMSPEYTGPVGTKHTSILDEPEVIVEHKQPRDAQVVKAERALAARKERQTLVRAMAARIREDERRERKMRELGFGTGNRGIRL